MEHCTSCGSPIPSGQGSSCSMCMGVMGWGNDGYYENWAEKQIQKEIEQKQAEEEYMQKLQEQEAVEILKQQIKKEEKEVLMDFAQEFIFGWTDATVEQVEKRIDEFLEKRHDQS